MTISTVGERAPLGKPRHHASTQRSPLPACGRGGRVHLGHRAHVVAAGAVIAQELDGVALGDTARRHAQVLNGQQGLVGGGGGQREVAAGQLGDGVGGEEGVGAEGRFGAQPAQRAGRQLGQLCDSWWCVCVWKRAERGGVGLRGGIEKPAGCPVLCSAHSVPLATPARGLRPRRPRPDQCQSARWQVASGPLDLLRRGTTRPGRADLGRPPPVHQQMCPPTHSPARAAHCVARGWCGRSGRPAGTG